MTLSLLALMLALSSVSEGRTAQPHDCVVGTALLLVQTPAEASTDGYEDGLRVIDSCGQETGVVDLPNPMVVWPTGRSNIAIVHSSPDGSEDSLGQTYLVDADIRVATALDIPLMSSGDFWRGMLLSSFSASDRHALVVGVDTDGFFDPAFYLVHLTTGDVVDLVEALPSDIVPGQQLEEAYIDPSAEAVVIITGGGALSIPISDPAATVFVDVEPRYPPKELDGCYEVVHRLIPPSLYGCEEEVSRSRWALRPSDAPNLEPILGLDELALMTVRASWSTHVDTTADVLRAGSFTSWNSAGSGSLRWLIFGQVRDADVGRSTTSLADGSTLTVYETTSGLSRRVAGMPSGPGRLDLNAAPGQDGSVLARWVPLTGTEPATLYVIDLEAANATFVAEASTGALSPDGVAIAAVTAVSGSVTGSITVGPVDGPLVDVGRGFGTWMTP